MDSIISSALEETASTANKWVTQSQLAKEFGIEGKNFFYILKNLECRVKGNSKTIRKALGSQQRFEINKEKQTVENFGYDDENVPDDDGFALENAKDNVLVNDYLPAMKAVCDKLEAQWKGQLYSECYIKRDLGYTRSSGHKAWRNIYRRLKDAGLVEELHAVVNEKVM
ncbi:uncharacterized protein LOC120195898 [Hibiscus syriacus]|uniref:uncharacterized protein LOC120195898 n=1 Tax=Hibiscus syriacus TaxID=106335 RepID=UPI001922C709|nr:uncharacterized protein LOC120195898 [Hibiscus syriacus]